MLQFLLSNSWIRIRFRIDLKNSDKFQPHHSHLVTMERRCLEDQDMSSWFCLLGRQPLGFHFLLTALPYYYYTHQLFLLGVSH